ncbi:hypothetical protein [Vibrio crassostreae]|uniref:hypothetical protein n=1 Tax=Vibrio crassostreae TaxID=246167 RepID=UPI001B30BC3A|nr:hypothetical protein [Vibrio crassostreae]
MSEPKLNPKMKKRLEWINKNDELMRSWLVDYIQQHDWKPPFNSKEETELDYIKQFLNDARFCAETAQTREECRNMKSAWNRWEKRYNNRKSKTVVEGNYTISMVARKELERLAKQQTCSFSKVLDTLLRNAKEMEFLQKKLEKHLQEENGGLRMDTAFLATFFDTDFPHQQAQIMTQDLRKEMETDKKQYQEELRELKKELKEKQTKIVELTAIIED